MQQTFQLLLQAAIRGVLTISHLLHSPQVLQRYYTDSPRKRKRQKLTNAALRFAANSP